MPIRLKYIGFNQGNPDFPKTNIITRFFIENDIIVNDIQDANVLLIGDFVNGTDINTIKQFNGIKIQYIAEPILYLKYCVLSKILFIHNICKYKLGCVSTKSKYIKYPLYLLNSEIYDRNTFITVNNYVKTCDIHNKRFCILINRHDWGNTRVQICEKISNFDKVDCPGKLLNNCSNEELNKVGIPTYVKQYKFIICSENFTNNQHGYITEKLMNACLSGAIPIYYGEPDIEDLKVFNFNRILLLNSKNINDIATRVGELYSNPDLLEEFYRQPVFCDTAFETISNMFSNINTFFHNLRNELQTNEN